MQLPSKISLIHKKTASVKICIIGTLFFVPIISWAADTRVDIAHFSQGDLHSWNTLSFTGNNTYYEIEEQQEGQLVLRADSNAGATVLYRRLTIDLLQTPILNWSWKVANVLTGIDEQTRDGDDYAARMIVVFTGGLAFWRTRVISYVWSSNRPVNSNWNSSFLDNVRMIAVESGAEQVGQWKHVRRNVYEDFQHLFDEQIEEINAVAIMTDTDNSDTMATAWYGDVWSSKE